MPATSHPRSPYHGVNVKGSAPCSEGRAGREEVVDAAPPLPPTAVDDDHTDLWVLLPHPVVSVERNRFAEEEVEEGASMLSSEEEEEEDAQCALETDEADAAAAAAAADGDALTLMDRAIAAAPSGLPLPLCSCCCCRLRLAGAAASLVLPPPPACSCGSSARGVDMERRGRPTPRRGTSASPLSTAIADAFPSTEAPASSTAIDCPSLSRPCWWWW